MVMGIFRAIGDIVESTVTRKQRRLQREQWDEDVRLRNEFFRKYVARGGTDLLEYEPPPDHPNPDDARRRKPLDLIIFLAKFPKSFVLGDVETGFVVDKKMVNLYNKQMREFMRSQECELRASISNAKKQAGIDRKKAKQLKIAEQELEQLAASTECESPIETIFLREVVATYGMTFSQGAFRNDDIFVRKQVEIGCYRVDFLFNDKLAVEIDGYEHHSGKDNADRDAKRDERIRAKGFKMLRIPAYRVHHNPRAAVSDLQDFLNMLK